MCFAPLALALAFTPALTPALTPACISPADVDFVVEGEAQALLRAFVFSLVNDNERFQAVVYVAGARLEPGADEAWLDLDGQRVEFHGSSTDPTAGWTRYLTTLDSSLAARVAAGLGVEAKNRVDPAHGLVARVELPTPVDLSSPSVPVHFILANGGATKIQFLLGGRQRNGDGRTDRLTVAVSRDGERLPDPGSLLDRDGLGVYVQLRPGEEHTLELDLRRWCDFPAAGSHLVKLSYALGLRHGERPPNPAFPEAWSHLTWDDAARATFELEIAPVTPPVLEIDGAPVAIEEAYVVARDNDNRAFDLHLRVDHKPEPEETGEVQLRAGGQHHRSPGLGYDGERGACSFELTPGEAAGLAAIFGVPLQRRAHPGHRLGVSFDPLPAGAPAPQSLKARFVLTNTGDVPIEYLDGGRSRNNFGRDNRFTFTITRNGAPVEPIQVHDFGGLAGIKALAPGERQVIELDLVHWCAFEAPGIYELDARLDFEVNPVGTWSLEGPWPARGHLRWDEQLRAGLRVTIE